MNILFVAPRFHSNQIDLVKKLKDEGHNVSFLVVRIGPSEDHSLINPVLIPIAKKTEKFFRIQDNNDSYVARAIPKISEYYRLLKSIKPNVIILRGGFNSTFSLFLIPYFFFRQVKLIYYTQGPKYVESLSISRKIHDFFIHRIFKIRWYTPVKYFVDKKPRIELKYIDFLPFFIFPKLGIQKKAGEKAINFLCIGKYKKRKNLHLLIDAALELKKMKKLFTITIIGSTDKEEDFYNLISEKVKHLNLNSEINILKNLPQNEIKSYYLALDVFILPSERETASISQIEAMSYGMPVICSKDNGTAHYVEDGISGKLIRPTVKEIKDAMLFYIDNHKMVEVHSVAAGNRIRTEFSVEESYKKFMSIIS